MMLSPAPPPSFRPQLKSDYFFNDDPSTIAQSPLQLPFSGGPSAPVAPVAPSASAGSAGASPAVILSASTACHHQQHVVIKVGEPRYYYVGDEDEEEGEKEEKGGRGLDEGAKGRTQHEAEVRLPIDWNSKPQAPAPHPSQASHTQPLPSFLPHDSSTGSDTPSPVPPAKASRGSPPNPPTSSSASSAASSTSTSPHQHPVTSAAASPSPSPVPFRPLSGTDGGVEYVGPFILGRVLGRGCTGTVRLGTHKHTGFEVAFKIIDKKYLNSDLKLWKKVKREIAILKLIEHPHVLKLYDVLETEQRLYLVLEHVKGGELFDYIVSKGRLDRDESLRLTAQIVQGLEHCHQHSICHRDLKPENLLLDDQHNIKIADFGMAQLMKNNSILKTSCGSPHYASPEIIEGQTYDARVTDVWSIGVILYALITGSLPFDHDNIPTLLSMVTKGHYTTPAHVPPDVSHLISRMLTVDPKKRIKLSEIRRHPCYKGTSHFSSSKSNTWPYNLAKSRKKEKRKKSANSSQRMNDDNHESVTTSSSSSSCSDGSSDSENEGNVDDSVLTDLEALGLDLNGNRDELVQKITQRRSSQGDQPNIERVFYRLLKKRRNSRLEQLSLLSPKISPRHFQHSQAAAGTGRYFSRARSEPEVPYRPLDESEKKQSVGVAGASRGGRASSGQHERIPPPVPGMMEGEWVHSVPGSSSTATTEGNASTASHASTGSNRVPISPLALDDDSAAAADGRRMDEDYSPFNCPAPQRQHSAPSSHHVESHPALPPAGTGSRETSAAAYYNRMVARSSPAAVTSMSVPASPYNVTTAAAVASAPSSPVFSATPHSMSPSSASAPYATSVMRASADAYPASEYIASDPPSTSSSHRHIAVERRSSVPSSSVPQLPAQIRVRASSATSSQYEHDGGGVARRLFIAEEKQCDVDAADALETDDFIPDHHPAAHSSYHYTTPADSRPSGSHSRTRSIADTTSSSSRASHAVKPVSPEQHSPEWTFTPRFHRVRFNPDNANPTSSALLPSARAAVSPVAKRSWFSSIFSRRPSLDLFSKGGKPKKAVVPPVASTGPSRAINGVYSNKTMLTIADEVRRALKSAGIRYVVKKGDSNGASLFECEVGREEEKEAEDRQQPLVGMRFLTRRKSTTAIDPPPQSQAPAIDFHIGSNRRASVGHAILGPISRTLPTPTNSEAPRVPLTASPEQSKRSAIPSIPHVPRHSAMKGRAKSPEETLSIQADKAGSQSANSTPRNGVAPGAVPLSASVPSSSVPNHTRHASLRSPPLASASAGNSRPGSPNRPPLPSHLGLAPAATSASGSSLPRRSRANSSDANGEDGEANAQPPSVKLIVEITSHHSNDLRCVRFLHVSGDEALYRQVQTDIQQRLRL